MDSNTRIAILGGTGMLGRSLISAFESEQVQVVRASHASGNEKEYALVDITSVDSFTYFMKAWEPHVVINSAAYTAVDQAETDYDTCFHVNSLGPEIVATACKEISCRLVHISTDYVFGGEQIERNQPYKENEKVAPCGIYGWSKYFGERAVLDILPHSSLVVRTSWLHGHHGRNFIDTIAGLAKEKTELKVVNDQIGSLTYVPWLAHVIVELTRKEATGILHASASDALSWFDVAKLIVEEVGSSCEINPQSTAESNRPAPRPAYSKLDVTNLQAVLEEEIPESAEFVKRHLRAVL